MGEGVGVGMWDRCAVWGGVCVCVWVCEEVHRCKCMGDSGLVSWWVQVRGGKGRS